MKLYLASNNEHKRQEFKEFFKDYEIILPKDEGIDFDVDETGKSYVENALLKAEALYSIIRKPCIADDSGLSVKALDGGPGIYSARYGSDKGLKTDKEKYEYLLKNMEDVEDRSAKFICAMVLIVDENDKYVVEKSVKGYITKEPTGSGGFGYDPVFFNIEANEVGGNLTTREKNTYSHRAKAAFFINSILEKEKIRICKEMNKN